MKYLLICIVSIISLSVKAQSFCLPEISSCIISPEERASFLVSHYWDLYPFGSEPLPADTTEQAMVNYIDLFKLIPHNEAVQSLNSTMTKAGLSDKDIFIFYNLFEKYLYDYSSPMKDEELFIPVLEAFLKSPILKEDDKIRPAYLLEMALKNRIGQPAADILLFMRNGKETYLHNLPSTNTSILYFYDPECEDCKIFAEQMNSNSIINKMIDNNKLQIIAIYTGSDKKLWEASSNHIPDKWLCGYDCKNMIENESIYDIKTFPTLYLLDKDKKVMIKDAEIKDIQKYLLRMKQ